MHGICRIILQLSFCRINALEELLEQQKISTDEKVAEESGKYSAALVSQYIGSPEMCFVLN